VTLGHGPSSRRGSDPHRFAYNPPPGYPPAPGPQPPPGYGPTRRRASMYTRQPVPGGGGPPSRLKRYGPWIALGLVILISGVLGYVLWTLRDVPDPGKSPLLSRTWSVYDRKGRLIETVNNDGQFYEKIDDLAGMGELNKDATLAAEDRDFYQHPAIDFARTASAAASDLLHRGNLQGASTITQQLVKVSVLTPQRSVFRKMQEAVLAFGLESQYSKDQILAMYLNRVYYGHNAYGIGAASRVYFGAATQPKNLTAGQAAFLAGLINGPSYYDPQVNFDGAKQRQLYVLDGMVKKGWLSQADADRAAQEDIKSELKYDQSYFASKAPHFVHSYVLPFVDKQLGADAQQGDLNIYTTLDLDLQTLAQRSVTTGVANARLKRENVNNADLMAAKPDTGEILAYVGSANYNNNDIAGQVDVIQHIRQPGSTFKPYVYEAALKDHKVTLATTLHDVPTDFGGGYSPKDWDYPHYMGDITTRTSLVQSRNVTAVETAHMEGIDNVIKQAQAQGIRTQLQPNLSTAIGGSDITMFEQLQGYQAFANQGTSVPLMGVTKVTDTQGNVLYAQQPGSQPNISHPMTSAEAYLVTDVLKDYNRTWGLGWKRQMAGKSGTTGGNDPSHRDAWMMAYNPDIVVGAWAGNTSPNTVNGGDGYCPAAQPHCASPGAVSAFGTETGEFILAPFINGLPSSMSDWFKRPDGIVNGTGCGSGGNEIYLAGTQGGVNCPTPPPTPVPTATPTPTPTPTPTATPTTRPTSTPGPTPTSARASPSP
jgi:membrane peptidoglycan carboxypeptidase